MRGGLGLLPGLLLALWALGGAPPLRRASAQTNLNPPAPQPPPPTPPPQPPPPPPAPERLESTEIERLTRCRWGCVEADVARLVWCGNSVNYLFCNRTLSGPQEVSVIQTEEGAINGYISLIRKVGGQNNDFCKSAMRAFMCWEFFPQCSPDGNFYYPVCRTACANMKQACGSGAWFVDCDQEFEEMYGIQQVITKANEVVQLWTPGKNPEVDPPVYLRGVGGRTIFGGQPCTGGAGALPASMALLGAAWFFLLML